jgi:[acyl-carrier-protein] S-malonyltransferase
MGKDIYDAFRSARDVFHEIDEAISFNLSNLIFNGSPEDLKLTKNTQPALMAVCMAFVRVLEKEFNVNLLAKTRFLAGHSLGECTALCASGAIALSDAAKILRTRGYAMAKACPVDGAMAAIIGMNIETLEKNVKECSSMDKIVQIANDNSPEQIVISGHKDAVKKVMKMAANVRTVLLEVSGPFHSILMEKAAKEVAEALCGISFNPPAKPIISNVTAIAESNNFKDLLVKQITNRVRWRESILFAEANSVKKCIEIGPGKVLTGLVKRISPEINSINVNSLDSLEMFANQF